MSSDANKAVMTLVAVAASLGAMDYHFLTRASAAEPPPQAAPLRVCADPNNLPFSNSKGEGFENALARLLARELGRDLQYIRITGTLVGGFVGCLLYLVSTALE